jgi:hypothetical protein
MRPCIEQSNDLALLSPFPSWLGCIINTSGYDFRKGQHSAAVSPGRIAPSIYADLVSDKDKAIMAKDTNPSDNLSAMAGQTMELSVCLGIHRHTNLSFEIITALCASPKVDP